MRPSPPVYLHKMQKSFAGHHLASAPVSDQHGRCLRMGWTGRAPAPNRSENVRGLRSTRSTSLCQPPESHTPLRISLLAALRFEVALHDRRRQRLDQQTLSSAAATVPAEAHDNCACRAFRRHPPRQRRVARRQTRSTARLLCQAFALLPGKRLRNQSPWVRHVALIAGSPLRLMGFAFDQPIPYPSGLSALVKSN
jgi:hypothetical protein